MVRHCTSLEVSPSQWFAIAHSQEVIDLIENNTNDTRVADVAAGLTIVVLDNEMGDYADYMD